ncbi:hypothetical protein NQ318_010668 [Aromia moschata]|uniref:Uncharacterized protein n=1 Tax=Aromia moschata TaxID=1265417 RepID=A0AAV8XS38_9CUCU|nr:hypothetical protein NQ318_010668 [Aromia moschata]
MASQHGHHIGFPQKAAMHLKVYEMWLLNNRSDAATSALRACRDKFEQNHGAWINLNFLVKLGKTFTEDYAILKEVFKGGRETTEDESRPGRPSTSKTDKNTEKIGLLDTVTLKRTRFESVEAVKAKAMEVLNQLKEADFQHSFQQWKSRMEQCRDRQRGTRRKSCYCDW